MASLFKRYAKLLKHLTNKPLLSPHKIEDLKAFEKEADCRLPQSLVSYLTSVSAQLDEHGQSFLEMNEPEDTSIPCTIKDSDKLWEGEKEEDILWQGMVEIDFNRGYHLVVKGNRRGTVWQLDDETVYFRHSSFTDYLEEELSWMDI